MSAASLDRSVKWMVIALASAFAILFLVLAYLRLAYPYEVEWMEGAMLDHSVRITQGQRIYTAPSIDFVPWLYPPLYYYVVAAAMKLFGVGFFAGRIVSFVSTLVTAGLLGWIVRHVTRSPVYAALGAGLYLATYHATGFYFDIARNDAFFTLLVVGAVLAAIVVAGVRGAIASGILLALAFLTKQQAVFFLPALGVWFWLRSRREGIIFSAVAIGVSLIILLVWNSASDGWLFYYLFHIPSAKSAQFSWLRAMEVLPKYVFGMFAVSSLAASVPFLLRLGTHGSHGTHASHRKSPTGLLLLMTLSGLAAGAISLGNEGGYANVMMPFAAFVVVLLPIAVHEVEAVWPRTVRYAWIAVIFQFVAFYFNPLSEKMLIASAHQRTGGDQFMRTMRAMPGEVYIPYHGFIARQAGKASHANLLATLDVLCTHDTTALRLQADLDSAFARHRFSAIIMEESSLIPCDSVAHYALQSRMLREPNVMLSRFGSEATRPEFVFLPK